MKLFGLLMLTVINTVICYVIDALSLPSVPVYMIGWLFGMAMSSFIASRNIRNYGS